MSEKKRNCFNLANVRDKKRLYCLRIRRSEIGSEELLRLVRFHSPKIDVPDSDWSESGTSVGRSRRLRFRGSKSALSGGMPQGHSERAFQGHGGSP